MCDLTLRYDQKTFVLRGCPEKKKKRKTSPVWGKEGIGRKADQNGKRIRIWWLQGVEVGLVH